MTISVIIPTLNEADNIERLITHLRTHSRLSPADILVIDAGSRDGTQELARRAGATAWECPQRGRAAQMNYGAERAAGEILYFVHADTLPPTTFITDLQEAAAAGYPVGCYRFRFDSSHVLLKVNAWFTRFDPLWCRGGDQSLYVLRSVFQETGGFCQDHIIMEDYEYIARVRKRYPFRIIPKDIVVSARKYEENSYLRVQFANFVVFNMYRFGASPQRLYHTYRQLLDYR